MSRALRTLVLLLLVAMLPLRAVAAVTIGSCAMGHKESVVAARADHGHGAASHAHHGSDNPPAKPATPSCSTCVEHCSSAACTPSAGQMVDALPVAQDRTLLAEGVAPAFISDQLDRPPLAPLH
jgi:hypothetical protein